MTERIWISWNRQRRNIGLAEAVGARLFMTEERRPAPIRLLVECARSWRIVHRERPRVCFVMNPSIFASCWLGLLAGLYGFKLITDLHTLTVRPAGARKVIFDFFFRFGLRRSAVVIVTNPLFRERILPINPLVVCIPDRLPSLRTGAGGGETARRGEEADKLRILCISSFDPDEPLRAVLDLDSRLEGMEILITGNWRRRFETLPVTRHIRFLGFVTAEEYDRLLASVDGIMVLTTEEGCLCCGAYEAFAAGAPLVLSGTRALRAFFEDAPVYTDNTADSLFAALQTLRAQGGTRRATMREGRGKLERKFAASVQELERVIKAL